MWDIDKQGIPQFVSTNYIELDKIAQISKFRSSVGHDYSDAFEHCRSMKHYFKPFDDIVWSTVNIYSPIDGIITRIEQEIYGTKIEIESKQYPAFRFQLFHLTPDHEIKINDEVAAGEYVGKHASQDTYADISVIVNDPSKQGRFISWFDVVTNTLFEAYKDRGAISRNDFIISKELRDAYPLDCNNFGFNDPLEKWFNLNERLR
ncbi:hypothetical protein SanaruYs_05880 [Chryseotalea sanaruensis]|uniref:Uncharacterized protein n=1 Tax=Chryseotalea sanaruensis TaxID=2482724 RepID=A0A401U633_9BACT|nr:hypothetical protein SanaruYs_05880 [Chryseotalea sanaruensis]